MAGTVLGMMLGLLAAAAMGVMMGFIVMRTLWEIRRVTGISGLIRILLRMTRRRLLAL